MQRSAPLQGGTQQSQQANASVCVGSACPPPWHHAPLIARQPYNHMLLQNCMPAPTNADVQRLDDISKYKAVTRTWYSMSSPYTPLRSDTALLSTSINAPSATSSSAEPLAKCAPKACSPTNVLSYKEVTCTCQERHSTGISHNSVPVRQVRSYSAHHSQLP